MSDTSNTSGRLDELEMRVVHQDQTIDELNAAITAQWKLIDRLERQVQHLAERVADAELTFHPQVAEQGTVVDRQPVPAELQDEMELRRAELVEGMADVSDAVAECFLEGGDVGEDVLVPALRKAVLSYPEDVKVVVLGTGGLSHQLDGERAGFINKDFDLYCLENIVSNPDELTKITRMELVEKAGAQGTEFLMWMMMRGALGDDVTEITRNYHIPISNTASGTLLLECAA